MRRRFRTALMVLACVAMATACSNQASNAPPLSDAARYYINPNQTQYSGGGQR